MNIDEIFIEYKLRGYIDDRKKYAKSVGPLSRNETIINAFKGKYSISDYGYRELVKKHGKLVQSIKSKFTNDRAKYFCNDIVSFYQWYNEQGQKCGYCGVTQDELTNIFKNGCGLLPLNDAGKRTKGTLEIERKNSSTNTYCPENIILACPLCNNAKSNLIDEYSWRELFVVPMKRYYKQLLEQCAGKSKV